MPAQNLIRLRPPPLWLLVLLASTSTLSMHMFVPALPFAGADLGVTAAQIQLSIGVYVFTLGLGQLVCGPISDAAGRRPVVISGIIVFVAGSLLCAAAGQLSVLLVGRFLQALGGAAGLTMARAVARDRVGASAGGSQKDISLLNLIMLIGPAISPMIGSALAVTAGWRMIFLALGLSAAALLLLVLLRMAETAPERRPLALGRALGEMGGLITHRRFVCTATGGALASTQTYGYFAAAPYILIDQLGVAPGRVGWFIGGILLGALLGTLASRWRLGRITQNGFILGAALVGVTSAALFLIAALTGLLTPSLLFALTFGLMLSGGSISPTALAASLDTVPERAGAAAGFFGAAQMLLGGICTLLVGLWPDHALNCSLMLTGSSLLSLCLLWLGRQVPSSLRRTVC